MYLRLSLRRLRAADHARSLFRARLGHFNSRSQTITYLKSGPTPRKAVRILLLKLRSRNAFRGVDVTAFLSEIAKPGPLPINAPKYARTIERLAHKGVLGRLCGGQSSITNMWDCPVSTCRSNLCDSEISEAHAKIRVLLCRGRKLNH